MTHHTKPIQDIEQLNEQFESATPQEILAWAVKMYMPDFCITSSFGASSGALLHMVSEIDRKVPIVFLDTNYHFPETIRFRDQLIEKYGLNVEVWEAEGGRKGFLAEYPDDLNKREELDGLTIPMAACGKVKTGADLCCWKNKVEPLRRALAGRAAYATSLRRDGGTELRARTKILERSVDPASGKEIVKINPMANWDRSQLWRYIHNNEIPAHPLWLQGYRSIGCAPCTRLTGAGEGERAGRWTGKGKDECGIHTFMRATA